MKGRWPHRAAQEHPVGSGVEYIRAQINGPEARSWLRENWGPIVRPEWGNLSEGDRQKIEDLQVLDRPKPQ